MKTSNSLKCWLYIKENRNYFYSVIVLFLLAVIVGFFYPAFFVDYIKKLIEKLAEQIEGMSFFQLFIFIFKNNATTAFFCMLLGFVLGIFPIIICLFNGYVLGFVAGRVSNEQGFSVLLRILPHGIFEIPALILSLGLGLKLGFFIFQKNKKKYLKENFENSLRCFVYVVLPLLLIAGIIEAGLMLLLSI